MQDVVVLKFGSSVLRSRGDLPAAVHEIYRWYRDGHRVVAVVSAIGSTTDSLLAEASLLQAEPEPGALAELLATGERAAAALLCIALDRAGVPARVADPREIRLSAVGSVLDSELAAVNQERLEELLEAAPVLVLPGFFGHDAHGRLHLLGRGGSDVSAIFVAGATRARRCRLIKDVDGVYDRDPAASADQAAHLLSFVDYESAVERASQLVQPKAVRLLEKHAGSVEVAGLCQPYETLVGDFETERRAMNPCPPARVLLLGLGTVGFGVYRRLEEFPRHFRIVGAFCRDLARHASAGVPAAQLIAAESKLASLEPDIVVDALPSEGPSHALVSRFLASGVHVVTANKALVASGARDLQRLAAGNGVALHYSATVGGSAPMIEAIERSADAGEIHAIAGILNGTSNFILDRCTSGLSFGDATAEAQGRGFAEADPSDDLSGADAERKLRILARHAFGQELDVVDREGLSGTGIARARQAARQGESLRQVARAWREHGRLHGEVRLVAVPAGHPLAGVRAEWNALQVTRANGATTTVTGRGAGRWPTTEAIVADLLRIRFRQIDAAFGAAAAARSGRG
ncbi:MAG: homoserine dehydrogenase, partial [Steroidobacteraceae bacterium]